MSSTGAGAYRNRSAENKANPDDLPRPMRSRAALTSVAVKGSATAVVTCADVAAEIGRERPTPKTLRKCSLNAEIAGTGRGVGSRSSYQNC